MEACRGHCPCTAAAHRDSMRDHKKSRRGSRGRLRGEMGMKMQRMGVSIIMELTLMLRGVLNI